MKNMFILPKSVDKAYSIAEGKMYFAATFSDGIKNAIVITIGMNDTMTLSEFAVSLQETVDNIRGLIDS